MQSFRQSSSFCVAQSTRLHFALLSCPKRVSSLRQPHASTPIHVTTLGAPSILFPASRLATTGSKRIRNCSILFWTLSPRTAASYGCQNHITVFTFSMTASAQDGSSWSTGIAETTGLQWRPSGDLFWRPPSSGPVISLSHCKHEAPALFLLMLMLMLIVDVAATRQPQRWRRVVKLDAKDQTLLTCSRNSTAVSQGNYQSVCCRFHHPSATPSFSSQPRQLIT